MASKTFDRLIGYQMFILRYAFHSRRKEAKNFPGIVYRPRKEVKGRETILVFKTGRLV